MASPEDDSSAGPTRPPHLDVVQRWFQAVISHPSGVGEGVDSNQAQELIRLKRDELEKVVRSTRRFGASERLSVYANAYYARLLECLGESFPVLKHALGEETFNEFAFGYLQNYPSRSYTLNRLGEDFARHLDETRPDRTGREIQGVNWPDFLIDLARLEWTIGQVFDGPGPEQEDPFDYESFQAISPEQWPQARLTLAVCLRLLQFSYPVNDYYTQARRAKEGEETPLPEARHQFVAISRHQYVVRRYELSEPQYRLLESLQSGQTIGRAIESAAGIMEADDEELAASLKNWFHDWTAEGFFQAVEG